MQIEINCAGHVTDIPEKRYILFRDAAVLSTWGIHFDPAEGKPVGEPFRVSRFDEPRPMIPKWIPPVGLLLDRDKPGINDGGSVGWYLGAG